MDTALLALRVALSLAAVLGLIWWLGRRTNRSGARGAQALKIVRRQSVGHRASIALVKVGDRGLLVGITDQQITMLTEVDNDVLALADPEPEVAATDESPRELGGGTGGSSGGGTGGGPLAGSILAPDTWRAAISALQQRTVRR